MNYSSNHKNGVRTALHAPSATWLDVEEKLLEPTIAVLPFGVLEQHGPHLPLETDTLMAEAIAKAVAAELGAVLLPAVPYGEAWGNEGYPGTVALSFDTVRRIVVEIGLSLAKGGTSGLIVVNGHYGNRAPIELALRELYADHKFRALLLDFPGLEEVAAAVCESKPAARGFFHADEFETSILLALGPDAVRMELAAAEYPDFPADYRSRPIPLREVSASGVVGDPTRATADKGRRMLDMLHANCMHLARPFAIELGVDVL